MPDAVTHPTPQQLAAFGLGKLPEQTLAAVAAHLESCPACRQAVASVTPDSFLGKVRAAGPEGSSFPPGLAKPGNAPSSADRPAIALNPCPDLPPELDRHPKYLILRELGRGGMGVVYQARHKEMDRQVVIKVINRVLLDRPGALERFHREIKAAALLSHPNIVTAYDAERVGDAHMLVMEFVPGQSLAEVVQTRGPLPIEFACHFARQVALGLQHAHERGLVHRDIKPQNLMLTLKNQVKILDFGLAKVVREEAKGTGLTAHDSCMGTPDYCAPEQATDARGADIRADLYSLGCTLYYLLSGRPPFREGTVVATFLAHQQKQPRPLPELRADVPAELWQVVARLLAKEPGERYQKPLEVVQVLAPFVKSGGKPGTKSGPMPAAASPEKGTMLAADTPQIRKVLREVRGNAPRKEVAATLKESPFEELVDTSALPKHAKGARESRKWLPAAWWKRPGVLAAAVSVSLALILMAVIIIKVNLQTPTGGPNKKNPPSAEAMPQKTVITPRKEVVDGSGEPVSPTEESETPNGAVLAEPPKAGASAPPAAGNRRIDEAIAAGVKALRGLQTEDGTWPHKEIGATALAGLTLLECGARADDEAVQRAAVALRKAAVTLTLTYSISLSILFFDRLGDPDDVSLIESLMVRLLAGQDAKSGGWSYNCPPISAAEKRRLQSIVDNRKAAVGRREPPKPAPNRNADKLTPEIRQQLLMLERSAAAPQQAIGQTTDNSNTQFAALALWVGQRHGIPIDRALTRLVQRFRTMQMEDGGWPYFQKPANAPLSPEMGSTATMTCAGLFCLAVSSTARAKYLNTRMSFWEDSAVRKGLLALSAMIGKPQGEDLRPGEQPKTNQAKGQSYYFLWALERVAVALDQKTIGEKDWYEWGAGIVLANQQTDGSWQGAYASGGADTCFALLFLKRSNLTADLTTILRSGKRGSRWAMNFNTQNGADYVAQLQGLGAILAIPVLKEGDGFDYRIVRDLSSRPAKLLNEDIQKFQREVQGITAWFDFTPKSVVAVLSVLRLPLPKISREKLHFIAFMPEELEQKLLRLEIDNLQQRHPGRSEDDIIVTKFRLKLHNGEYEPEVIEQKVK